MTSPGGARERTARDRSRSKRRSWTLPNTDVYDTPVDYTIRSEYPGNVTVEVSNKHKEGTKFIGTSRLAVRQPRQAESIQPRWLQPNFDRGQWKAYHSPGHAQNFVDGVLTREECICPADIGHRSVTPGHFAYVSHAVGRPLTWNATKGEIVGDAEAEKVAHKAHPIAHRGYSDERCKVAYWVAQVLRTWAAQPQEASPT